MSDSRFFLAARSAFDLVSGHISSLNRRAWISPSAAFAGSAAPFRGIELGSRE